MLDDWLAHTPIDVIAKNFGVNASVFANIPATDPYILNATVATDVPSGGNGQLTGDASFVFKTLSKAAQPVPGTGGEFYKIDSTNFPVATTIAATFVRLKPGGLRELHWHPNVSFKYYLRVHVLIKSRLKSGSISIKVLVVLLSSLVAPLLEPSTFQLVILLFSLTTLGKS
jgi:hypothetical protein